jgi:hypothetical protein
MAKPRVHVEEDGTFTFRIGLITGSGTYDAGVPEVVIEEAVFNFPRNNPTEILSSDSADDIVITGDQAAHILDLWFT